MENSHLHVCHNMGLRHHATMIFIGGLSGAPQMEIMSMGTNSDITGPVRFLRRKDVERITGLKTSTLYAIVQRGEFPSPVRITAGRVAWIEREVHEWMQSRISVSRPTAA